MIPQNTPTALDPPFVVPAAAVGATDDRIALIGYACLDTSLTATIAPTGDVVVTAHQDYSVTAAAELLAELVSADVSATLQSTGTKTIPLAAATGVRGRVVGVHRHRGRRRHPCRTSAGSRNPSTRPGSPPEPFIGGVRQGRGSPQPRRRSRPQP